MEVTEEVAVPVGQAHRLEAAALGVRVAQAASEAQQEAREVKVAPASRRIGPWHPLRRACETGTLLQG
jgi:hypothetical protein